MQDAMAAAKCARPMTSRRQTARTVDGMDGVDGMDRWDESTFNIQQSTHNFQKERPALDERGYKGVGADGGRSGEGRYGADASERRPYQRREMNDRRP